ncbi:MAG: PEP-CTERM sorting domain-containing protein [Gemmatimonadaceae bacterium]
MRISRQMLGMAAASMLGITASLSAQNIEFHGAVFGCFTTGAPCASVTTAPFAATDGVGGPFQYTADGFDGTTFANLVSFPGSGTSGSFGNVMLRGDYTPAIGTKLQLEFFFNPASTLLPVGSFAGTPTVGSTELYDAMITGSVVGVDGGIVISFGSPVTFAFTNGGTTGGGFTHSGFATLTVDNLSLGKLGNSPVSGHITTRITDTPEPATVALFATGLVGLIPVARRRAASKLA